MGRGFESLAGRFPRRQLLAGDVVEDPLHEDDADVNAAGDVGQELGEEIVDGVEGIAGEDAVGGRGAVG